MSGLKVAPACSEPAESEKLELQAKGENLDAILQALPTRGAKKILDVGCGSGALSRALARTLGGSVEVYGIDISAEHIHYSRKAAEGEGLSNVRYLVGDIMSPPDDLIGSFDLVYEKYVLMLMSPKKLGTAFLSQMKGCLRPGGEVACIEADINFGQDRYPPPSHPLSEVLPEVISYYREQGLIEWRCGIQLYNQLRLVPFSNVNIRLVDGRIIAGGVPEQLAVHANLDVENLIRPCLEVMGMTELLDEVARQWREYLSSAENFLYNPIFVGTGSA